MKKKILFFVFLSLLNVSNVMAITIIPEGNSVVIKEAPSSSNGFSNNENGCSGSSNASSNNNPTDAKSNLVIDRTVVSSSCNETAPYNVVIMVDNTDSMNSNNKIKATNQTIRNIVNVFKNKSPNSVITLFKFNTSVSDSMKIYAKNGYNGDYLTKPPAKNTNLQKGYMNIFNMFKNNTMGVDKNNYVPFVIIITDGYPTALCKNTDVINGCGGSLEDGYTSGGPYNAYMTAKTLSSLKRRLINDAGYNKELAAKTKIVTVGVGMDKRDEYVKFILNPSAANYKNLYYKSDDVTKKENKDLWTVESRNLYLYLANHKKPSGASDYICRCVSAHEKWLYERNNRSNGTIQMSVYKSCNNDTNCNKANYGLATPNTSWIVKEPVDGNLNSSDNNEIINGITSLIEDSIKCDTTETKTKYQSNYYSKYKQVSYKNNTIKKDINVGNVPNMLYYKVPDKIVVTNKDTQKDEIISNIKFISLNNYNKDAYDPSKSTSCVQINPKSLGLSVIVSENSSFRLDGFTNVPYKGNGFTFGGTISNTITYDYASSTIKGNSSYLNYNISPLMSGFLVTGDEKDWKIIHETNESTIRTFSHVSVSDIYTDPSCTNSASITSNTDIWNQINPVTPSESKFISTVDSNDKTKTNLISTGIIDGIHQINGKSRTYNYNIVLNRGCIATSDVLNGDNIINKGFVLYSDVINDNCDGNFIKGINEEGKNLYYIPMDYDRDIVSLEINGVNFSSVEDIPITFSAKCSVNIDNKKILKYNYKVINTKNPFPKSSKKSDLPENWREWYSVMGNISRMRNSYEKEPLYEITIDKYKSDSSLNTISDVKKINEASSYTSWANINKDGKSNIICNGDLNSINKSLNFSKSTCVVSDGSFCKLGEFKSNCDVIR